MSETTYRTSSRIGLAVILGGWILSGCGGATPEAEAPSSPEAEASKSAAAPKAARADDAAAASDEEEASGVPTKCSPGKDECLPPAKWVNKLCNGVFPEVALYMFRQGTPWQRMYLRGKTEAVNASGGASVAGFLEFDEEVLVLRHRGASSDGIQIGDGSGQYDALRWNGSCVSLEGGEVTSSPPPRRKHSRVEWKWLGEPMREALKKDSDVQDTFRARRSECKGATMGAVTKKCEQLDQKLIDVIAAYVRSGAELPEPSEQP